MSTAWRRPAGAFWLAAVFTVLAAAPPAFAEPPSPGALKINEIESSGGAVTDFVELINNGAGPADIGGYVIKDNDDTHSFTVPAGTTIAANGYYVADTDTGATAFGLGAADSARLFEPGGHHPDRQPHLGGACRDDVRALPQRLRRVHHDDQPDPGHRQ